MTNVLVLHTTVEESTRKQWVKKMKIKAVCATSFCKEQTSVDESAGLFQDILETSEELKLYTLNTKNCARKSICHMFEKKMSLGFTVRYFIGKTEN